MAILDNTAKSNKKLRKPIFSTDYNNLIRESKVFYYKSSGPGGQRKNKRETAVKLHHIPSGLWVIGTEARSQSKNKEIAFRRLKDKLTQLNKKKKYRIPTKISVALQEKILHQKKMRSEKKKLRRKVKTVEEY